MANISLLQLQFEDNVTPLNAENMNAIVSKINELVNSANNSSGNSGSGTTPTAPSAPTITINGSTVSITAASDTSIRYTIDGSVPTATTGTLYSAPFSPADSCTIKAVAVKSGVASNVSQAQYIAIPSVITNQNITSHYVFYNINGSGKTRTLLISDLTGNLNNWTLDINVKEGSPLKVGVQIAAASVPKTLSQDPANPTYISDTPKYDSGWIKAGMSKTIDKTALDSYEYTDKCVLRMVITYDVTANTGTPTLEEIKQHIEFSFNGLTLEYR